LTLKVCVSIPPRTVDEAVKLIRKAEDNQADLIEVRLDSLKKHELLQTIRQCTEKPLIATNKNVAEHGKFVGTETERRKILLDAARSGFDYVDVDLSIPDINGFLEILQDVGVKTVVSFHDFEETPSLQRLSMVFERQIVFGADVCKIVTTAKHIEDNLTVLRFVSEAAKKAKVVCFAMGELGKTSRLLSPAFGAFFTFASIDEKRKTAKGQLSIQEMRKAYEILGLK